MRIALFASGSPLSIAALDALDSHTVTVVVPRPSAASPRGAWRAARARVPQRPLVARARRLGARVVAMRSRADRELERALRGFEPDLLCIASFPFVLERTLLALPRFGGLNLHPSLLPRHRGPDPLFWTYFLDERETGMTVHRVSAHVDAGDIFAQERVSVGHGQPVTELYADLAARGARLLAETVRRIEDGSASGIAQDESRASRDPSPAGGEWRREAMGFATDRMWHFLAGLGARHSELLTDRAGRPVAHGAAVAFRRETTGREPGSIERHAGGLRVHCGDGTVDLRAPSLAARARRAVDALARAATRRKRR